MPDIVLSTLNAKFIHASFGLRCLLANLGDLRPRGMLAEFDVKQRPVDVAETLMALQPRILGLGIYIWNAREASELVSMLKRLRPDLIVVLGGPEISFETDRQPVAALADYVITGEGDLAFAALCRQLLGGTRPAEKVIAAPLPDFGALTLPYEEYTEGDLAHRVIYVEASRGCPFSCEFCLSSLDVPVRTAPLPEFLAAMGRLLDHGARGLKFVDRTFNLNVATGRAILEFLLTRWQPGRLFHFEMIPDRLPEALREVIAKFPVGALQFEVGVQSLNPDVLARISRRQDEARLAENFRFLREQTGVHVHADLIAGLPGETLESLATGFDRLVALGPQEIQFGILKRLRGTPIVRHDAEWAMRYNPHPPYEILENRLIDFATMQRLRRFARYWDLVANSGNFVETAPLLWEGGSPFWKFLRWSDWLFAETRRTDAIALPKLSEHLFRYLTAVKHLTAARVAQSLARDYQRVGRSDPPECVRPFLEADARRSTSPVRETLAGMKRQARHRARAMD